MRVNIRKLIFILVQRSFNLSELLERENPHAIGFKIDFAGWIKVTIASGFRDNVLCLDKVSVNKLVKDTLRSKDSALARVLIDPICESASKNLLPNT